MRTVVYYCERWVRDSYAEVPEPPGGWQPDRRILSVAPGHGIWLLKHDGRGNYSEMFCISDLMTDTDVPLASPHWRETVRAMAPAFNLDPEVVEAAIEDAVCDVLPLPELIAGCCANLGPFADLGEISREDLRDRRRRIWEAARIAEATASARSEAMRRRRRQFAAERDSIVLALISGGTPYRCAHPDCRVAVNLTIDHRVPLSRGGRDDLSNLQFMCRSHNSQKGAAMPPEGGSE